jgi:folate-binding protein YgfZ
MYRLRAKADIRDVSEEFRLLAAWGDEPESLTAPVGILSFRDPRLPELGLRVLAPTRHATDIATPGATAEDYHAHRIALGVPEGGKDYAFGDAFPHEADLDQLHGVSFSKGCFVGQEVVSRMHNRATARKRVVPIAGEAPLASGAEIVAGVASIGVVGSVADRQALALLRLDRAAEAEAKGEALLAGGVTVRLVRPRWAKFDMAPSAARLS